MRGAPDNWSLSTAPFVRKRGPSRAKSAPFVIEEKGDAAGETVSPCNRVSQRDAFSFKVGDIVWATFRSVTVTIRAARVVVRGCLGYRVNAFPTMWALAPVNDVPDHLLLIPDGVSSTTNSLYRCSPKSLPQIGHPIIKAHDVGRTFKVPPHATSTVNKFSRSTQFFKCQPEFVVLDVVVKAANRALELFTLLGCRGG
jgi:hypothetical protein